MMFAGEFTVPFNEGARNWRAHRAAVFAKLREFAPYVAIELVMPGGSLMALLLWLYRRQKKTALLAA